MKIKSKVLLMSLLVCILLIGSIFQGSSIGEKIENDVVQIKFDYPVKPGTDEWVKLGSKLVREEACQIPEDSLRELSTEQLIELVLEYPYIVDVYCFNTLQAGFEVVSRRFNGLRELLSREDNGTKLLSIYNDYEIKNASKNTTMDYIFDLSLIELMLAQKSVYNNLTSIQKDKLNIEVKYKYDQKNDNIDLYGFTTNTYYIVKSVQNELSYVATTVKTPKGNDVDAAICVNDWTQEQKDYYKERLKNSYPTITIVDEPTGNYNCHSYAYYNQSTNNDRWIMQPGAFITDGSFTEIENPTYYNLEAGTRFFYNTPNPNDNHSAIFLENLGGPVDPDKEYYQLAYVESKWGPNCLVRHWIGVGPYDTSNIVSYKKN